MKYWIYIAIALLSVTSCQDVQRPERPENLLSKQKMMEVLADAYISNASRSGVNNRVLKSAGIKLDSLFYANHQVDSLEFVVSNAYYSSVLNEYEEIIKGTQEILKKKKALIDTVLNKEKRLKEDMKKDSTKEGYSKKYGKPKLIDAVQEEDEE